MSRIDLKKIFREACVCNLEEAILAEENGVDRIELCESLELDGLTPSPSLLESVLKEVKIPVRIMIRERAGNFQYSKAEIQTMLNQIDIYSRYEIEGIVVGCLTADNMPDLDALELISSHLNGIKITFHKAIDEARDLIESVKQLNKIKAVDYVLTSGGERTALEGVQMIKKMVDVASPNLHIMPGGKVSPDNLEIIAQKTNATAFHGRKIF